MSDAALLLQQELALAKYEFYEEARKTKTAVVALGIGIGVGGIGGLLLIIMLVHVLRAITDWPLWVCYGTVGGLCTIVGLVSIYRGSQQISHINLVPQQTVVTMKENIKWFKKRAVLKGI
jgi:hypothetical protein